MSDYTSNKRTYTKPLTNDIAQLLLPQPLLMGSLLYLQPMLVRTGDKVYGLSRVNQAMESSKDVGRDQRVKVAYVRHCERVS